MSIIEQIIKDLQFAEVDRIFYFYDRPLLFTLSTLKHKRFLALFIDENIDEEIFLYTEISNDNLKKLLSDEVTIYELYKRSPLNKVFLVKKTSDTFHVIQKNSDEIEDSILPPKTEYLELS